MPNKPDARDGLQPRVIRDVRPPMVFLFLFLSISSHGFLDAATDGGLGIAFFRPFSNYRYFFPWNPIVVSPLSVGRFFYQGFRP